MGKQKRCSPAAPNKDLPVLERRLMETAAQALLFVSAQKRQKILRGGKQKSQETTETHVKHRDDSHVVAVVQHHGQSCGAGVVGIRETRTENTFMRIYGI